MGFAAVALVLGCAYGLPSEDLGKPHKWVPAEQCTFVNPPRVLSSAKPRASAEPPQDPPHHRNLHSHKLSQNSFKAAKQSRQMFTSLSSCRRWSPPHACTSDSRRFRTTGTRSVLLSLWAVGQQLGSCLGHCWIVMSRHPQVYSFHRP